jgi:mannose-6-phosphate isomerase-like protein (cupin superfamily)
MSMERQPNLRPVGADDGQHTPGRGLGGTIKVIATPRETGVRVAVVEEVTPPRQGPPMHMHMREDEIFYVVEGRMRFWRGEEIFDAGPGAVVLLPRRLPHTFKNLGDEPSRVLFTINPDGLEGFFEEVERRGWKRSTDLQKIEELAKQYGVTYMVDPPPIDPTSGRSSGSMR